MTTALYAKTLGIYSTVSTSISVEDCSSDSTLWILFGSEQQGKPEMSLKQKKNANKETIYHIDIYECMNTNLEAE